MTVASKRVACLVAAAVLVGAGATASGASNSGRPLPGHDSFYRYDGHRPLGAIRPGTVLKERPITVTLGPEATPISAAQLLYRTRDQRGRPAVTVTTVLRPALPLPGPDIVGYFSFYDGFGSECDPSYTLGGGTKGSSAEHGEATEEELLILHYVLLGMVVTVPDFEGEQLHWGANLESGDSSLDAIRATESFLHAPATTKVALTGYSGGAIAADWASELAPRYAPRLNLVAVAEGGIPVDWAHNLRYVAGGKAYAGTLPAVLMTLHRAFGLRLHRYLSRRGAQIIKQVHRECITDFLGAYPGLRPEDMLKHRYRQLLRIPAVARDLNRLIMGQAPGHPRAPLFMGIGDADGRGDGVMLLSDTTALAHEYCGQRVPVKLSTYHGLSHEAAGIDFEPVATTYLLQRFAGLPPPNDCAKIGRGGSLAPLPVRKR